MQKDISFKSLCKLEPELYDLEECVKQHKKHSRARRHDDLYCANRWWYGYDTGVGYKSRVCELVGWSRKGEGILGTEEAYRVVYHYLYDLLPNCKHDDMMCGCYSKDVGVLV